MARHAAFCGPVIELWASPEPTIARIGKDEWRNQLRETGHDARFPDIDLIADLGVAASRYPVLWEHGDLEWARPRLARLRERGVEPIVTLLHHGSGPAHTSLVDPAFPQLFADYAESVAGAFPWVQRWTPINEPLTTARFSTLYGHWYPNLRDDRAFGAAIVNQAAAIQLAFERIRTRNPGAKLMVTEDLQGFTAADRSVRDTVEFLRERAYLSLELVAGRVNERHRLWRYLTRDAEVPARLLREIAARSTPPDLVGWNWYPYSERALWRRDGELIDVGAVTLEGYTISPRPLLRAAFERLGLPQALSEVHLHADENARAEWLLARYDDALALREDGVPVEAVGAWAAFGMVDWDSLLCRRANVVEDGIFRFAGPNEAPQETAVSRTLRTLASSSGDVTSRVIPSVVEGQR